MILWRVSNYASLDGAGGLHVAGRWHSKGRAVVYCAENPATALLETLVHMEIDAEDRPERFQVLRVEGMRTPSTEAIRASMLPAGWVNDLTVSQTIGDRWLAERRTLLLKVPSVLLPETSNILINPLHPEARSLKIGATYQHPYDARLFPR